MDPEYPPKTGKCWVVDCKETPTDWHHIYSEEEIVEHGEPIETFHDSKNLRELCTYHYNLTTSTLVAWRLTRTGKLFAVQPRTSKQISGRRKRSEKLVHPVKEQRKYWSAMMDRKVAVGGSVQGSFMDTEQEGKWKKYISPMRRDKPNSVLYPPDHWMHDPTRWDWELCDEFEKDGWKWKVDGSVVFKGEKGRVFYDSDSLSTRGTPLSIGKKNKNPEAPIGFGVNEVGDCLKCGKERSEHEEWPVCEEE